MDEKPLVWLHGTVKTPPFSGKARVEVGFYLRKLQQGQRLSLPHSRPMPVIGPHCHELRIQDEVRTWRLVYRIDSDAVVVLEVFEKRTQATPAQVIETCQRRLATYDSVQPKKEQ